MANLGQRTHRSVHLHRNRVVAGALMVAAVAALSCGPAAASSGGGRKVSDAANTRTVYLVVTALVLLAVGLAAFTWWFWRSTRREHEALAPLEVMGAKRFADGDPSARQTLLDASRPVGAQPLAAGGVEPLLAERDDEPVAVSAASVGDDDGADAADATTIIAAVAADAGAEPEAASVDGDAAADASDPAETPSADDETPDGAGEPAIAASDADALDGTPVEADLDGDETPTPADGQAIVPSDAPSPEPAESVTAAVAAAAASGRSEDRTELIPVTGPLVVVAATEERASQRVEPAASPATATVPVTSSLIDPGLHVAPPEAPQAKQLSLAELASLDSGFAPHFEDDDLAATPSAGVPVIESAEAWVERQLTASRANGDTTVDEAAAGDAVDGDEAAQAPAAAGTDD